jgi:hypothetical protein
LKWQISEKEKRINAHNAKTSLRISNGKDHGYMMVL